jgi:hypothetical protein
MSEESRKAEVESRKCGGSPRRIGSVAERGSAVGDLQQCPQQTDFQRIVAVDRDDQTFTTGGK